MIFFKLAELPDRWDACKKLAVRVKQNVLPLQANEVNLIRKRLALFDIQQGIYRDTFRKLPVP